MTNNPDSEAIERDDGVIWPLAEALYIAHDRFHKIGDGAEWTEEPALSRMSWCNLARVAIAVLAKPTPVMGEIGEEEGYRIMQSAPRPPKHYNNDDLGSTSFAPVGDDELLGDLELLIDIETSAGRQPCAILVRCKARIEQLSAEVSQAETIVRGMVRLADMGLEESLREPEEDGNYAVHNRAVSWLAALSRPNDEGIG